jgi:hypothetical protein
VKRRGPGRPKLLKAERKAAIFSVRLAADEREAIEQAAQASGLKAAAWARMVLLAAARPES